MNNDWCIPESWDNSILVYSEKADVLYFDLTSEYETAVYTVAVPEGMSYFSLSFKAGNSRSVQKPGTQDTGYITVSTDDNIIAKTPMIKNNINYVLYSLNSVPIQADQLHITAEAYNSYGDGINFYFGEFNIEFYETTTENFATEYYFLTKTTPEKVQNINRKTLSFPDYRHSFALRDFHNRSFAFKKGKEK